MINEEKEEVIRRLLALNEITKEEAKEMSDRESITDRIKGKIWNFLDWVQRNGTHD